MRSHFYASAKRRMASLTLILAAALAAAWCMILHHRPAYSSGEFAPMPRTSLLIATDLHYLAEELSGRGVYFDRLVENADGKMTAYSEELLEAFAQQVIGQQPDALILSGDLSFNGEAQSHRRLVERMVDGMRNFQNCCEGSRNRPSVQRRVCAAQAFSPKAKALPPQALKGRRGKRPKTAGTQNKRTSFRMSFCFGGDDRTRTDYLYNANVALYQVSYAPRGRENPGKENSAEKLVETRGLEPRTSCV